MMNNILENLPENLDTEVFEQILKGKQISIERIISRGHQSPESGWYDQDSNEWVMVLAGTAILSFVDAPDVTMSKGDYINLPAHKKHKVKWTTPDTETIWLAVHY